MHPVIHGRNIATRRYAAWQTHKKGLSPSASGAAAFRVARSYLAAHPEAQGEYSRDEWIGYFVSGYQDEIGRLEYAND